MKRSSTPSFVLTLKLNTNAKHEKILHKRFYAGWQMRNEMASHARKALASMRQDKEYRALMQERYELRGKNNPEADRRRSQIGKRLKEIRLAYGLSEYQFHDWIGVQSRKSRHIDSHTAQKIASEVWTAVSAVLYKSGKSVHFKRFDAFRSMESKTNKSGIRFVHGKMVWGDHLVIQPQFRKGDDYAREALTHRIKYCRILRKPMGTTYHYYLQIVLEGIPPQKHKFLPDGKVGIDPGTSTESVVSERGCILTELAPERPDIREKAAAIQQRMDRSKRAMNPDNYHADGTVKKGKKFKYSKAYKRDQMQLKTLHRRAMDTAIQSENRLANRILCEYGTDVYTEPMNYKALQARAKETKISEKTGRYQSKKRYGGSLGKHAPARFKQILKRKLGYIGKELHQVNVYSYKASQYDHVTDDYERTELNDRTKWVGGHLVQRDLYSAFLLMNAHDLDAPDKGMCNKTFPQFLINHNTTIKSLLDSGRAYPSCMGLDDFRNEKNWYRAAPAL